MQPVPIGQQRIRRSMAQFQYAVAEDRGFIEAGWIPALRQGLACRKSCRTFFASHTSAVPARLAWLTLCAIVIVLASVFDIPAAQEAVRGRDLNGRGQADGQAVKGKCTRQQSGKII
mmetsp:Transcript_145474/g.206014  ORF Transcript_145474/g.206014 Transcript_145474/m.206014 type:complete len:117 (+) Transcript_145474:628-978(+)